MNRWGILASVLVGVLVLLMLTTWSPVATTGRVGAQAFPPIRAAGLFTFPGDWSKIPATSVTLFFPGQASWEFLTSARHPGSQAISTGTACLSCHTGTEKTLGDRLVKPGPLEPEPIAGKRGWVEVSVRAAFDDEYLYMRFEWQASQPGASHELWRYDGRQWVAWGGPKPEATRAGIPPSYEDRIALMIAGRNVQADNSARTGFNQVGCFMACHTSMRYMPADVVGDRVRGHPYFGTGGLNVSDMRHYLLLSRTATDETGGWDKVKTRDEIERLKAEGSFLDLWQWRAYRSNPVGYAGDDYVLEYRLSDSGRTTFSTPARASFMYDQTKTGFQAVPEARLVELLPSLPLVEGQNAVPITPAARFAVGDLLPRNILRTPTGSSADILANGSWANGRWVVELRRKLVTGNPDDAALRAGRVYRFGMSLFDDKVTARWHFVSFVQTLGLGAGTKATVRAVRIKP